MKTFTSSLKGEKLMQAYIEYAFPFVTQNVTVRIDEDTWQELFKPKCYPKDHSDGDGPRRYDHQISEKDNLIWNDPANKRYIWTEVDGDNGGTFLVPGKHTVNYQAFFLASVPFDTELIEVPWIPADEEIEKESNDTGTEECQAGQLEAEHGDNEHAIYGVTDWKAAVDMDETKKGYWQWVAEQVQENQE